MGWWTGLRDQAEWERDQARYDRDPQLYVLASINQNLKAIRTFMVWIMILLGIMVVRTSVSDGAIWGWLKG